MVRCPAGGKQDVPLETSERALPNGRVDMARLGQTGEIRPDEVAGRWGVSIWHPPGTHQERTQSISELESAPGLQAHLVLHLPVFNALKRPIPPVSRRVPAERLQPLAPRGIGLDGRQHTLQVPHLVAGGTRWPGGFGGTRPPRWGHWEATKTEIQSDDFVRFSIHGLTVPRNKKLRGAPGIATRSKDATSSSYK